MDLIGLPNGTPGGGHLGVTHMIKHYLDPSEVWEDLVTETTECRPWDLLERLADLEPEAWKQWKNPGDELRACWQDELVVAYQRGYLSVVRELAAPLTPPGARDWKRIERGWLTVTFAGVLLIVSEIHADGSAKLRTAFRPVGYPLKSHRAVPMDAASRSLRAILALKKAQRRATSIAGGAR